MTGFEAVLVTVLGLVDDDSTDGIGDPLTSTAQRGRIEGPTTRRENDVTDQATPEILAERQRLGLAYVEAWRWELELKTDAAAAAAQKAWDAMIEFVAENGLTGTTLDPRVELDQLGWSR